VTPIKRLGARSHRPYTRVRLDTVAAVARLATVVVFAGTLSAGCSPRSPERTSVPATFARGEGAYQRGDYERAIGAYRAFLEHPSDPGYVPRAWFKIALSQYRLAEYRAALATLDELHERHPRESWVQAEALRGDAHLALGNTVSALQAWSEAWRIAAANDRPALRARFDRVIESLGPSERESARDLITDPEIRTWVDRPPAPPAAFPETSTLEAAAVATPRTRLKGKRIGCLLPLSGRYQVLGELALRGVQLALGPERDRLLVKDTNGGVEVARAAFAELVQREEVIAVIGPLRSEEASTVAPLAERAGMPMLLLSQREGLSGRFVLQAGMTRSHQARALADHALRRGMRHLGILAPEDSYGRDFTDRFRNEWEARRGRVTFSEFYDPQSLEVTGQVGRARARHDLGRLDAIFVPDSARAVTTVAAAVRAAIPGIALLGTNDWNEPARLAEAAGVLEDAVFVAGFFAASPRPATRAFVESFENAYASAPEVLAAQAHDAASILREMLQRAPESRETALETLLALGPIPGASGLVRVSGATVLRELHLIRFEGGALREISADDG
jgi:ABC-type branched-subunit amino acid transport system substrate-binding protein